MAKITYADKVNTVTTATPNINKVRDVDLNEIKTIVNSNDDVVVSLNSDIVAAEAEIVVLNNTVNALKNRSGWANYADTGAALSIGTTATKVTIDAATVIDAYLPLEIRNTGQLWNGATSKLTPISVGDAYEIRFSFTVATKTNPNRLDIMFDIGGGGTPTNVIASISVTMEKTAPFDKYITIPIFSLETFVANGGQIFAATDVGAIEISARSIFINRTHSEL